MSIGTIQSGDIDLSHFLDFHKEDNHSTQVIDQSGKYLLIGVLLVVLLMFRKR